MALFRGERLTDWALLSAPDNTPSYQRIGCMVEGIAAFLTGNGRDVTLVACEKPVGIQGARPAPELDTLIRSLKSFVTGRAKLGQRKLSKRCGLSTRRLPSLPRCGPERWAYEGPNRFGGPASLPSDAAERSCLCPKTCWTP